MEEEQQEEEAICRSSKRANKYVDGQCSVDGGWCFIDMIVAQVAPHK